MEHGYAPNLAAALDTIRAAGFHSVTADLSEAVGAAHASGALAVIAHPGRHDGEIVRYEPDVLDDVHREAPFDGIEVYYPIHSPDQTAAYARYAETRGLLVSAGSDSHGPRQRPPIAYPARLVRPLLERCGIQVTERNLTSGGRRYACQQWYTDPGELRWPWRAAAGSRAGAGRRRAMPYLEIETHEARWHVLLDRDRLTIGRLETDDIVLPYHHISRRHAEIRQVGDTWWISNLGSTNGMRVRGRLVSRHPLRLDEPVDLAPGIVMHLVAGAPAFDAAGQATMRMPSADPGAANRDAAAESAGVPSTFAVGLSAFAASGVRPPPATPLAGAPGTAPVPEWRTPESGDPARRARPAAPTADLTVDDLEGDLFRRSLRRGVPARGPANPATARGRASDGRGATPLVSDVRPANRSRRDPVSILPQRHRTAMPRLRPEPCCPSQNRCPRCQSANPVLIAARLRRGRGSDGLRERTVACFAS